MVSLPKYRKLQAGEKWQDFKGNNIFESFPILKRKPLGEFLKDLSVIYNQSKDFIQESVGFTLQVVQNKIQALLNPKICAFFQ